MTQHTLARRRARAGGGRRPRRLDHGLSRPRLRPDAALGRGQRRPARVRQLPAGAVLGPGRPWPVPLRRAGPTSSPPNFPPEPHAIHGDGWTSPWARSPPTPPASSWSWSTTAPATSLRYRASQIFWLYPDRLEIAMSLTNRGPEPMPFGLGHHPYFGDRDQALLSAEVGGVWLPDDLNVPKTARAGAGRCWGFRLRRPVDELVLDHVFQGWDGKALHRLARGRPGARDHGRRALPPSRRLRAARPAVLLRRAGQHDRRRLQPDGRRASTAPACGCWPRANRCAAA